MSSGKSHVSESFELDKQAVKDLRGTHRTRYSGLELVEAVICKSNMKSCVQTLTRVGSKFSKFFSYGDPPSKNLSDFTGVPTGR